MDPVDAGIKYPQDCLNSVSVVEVYSFFHSDGGHDIVRKAVE